MKSGKSILTYKDHKALLEEINPFSRWVNLDRKYKFSPNKEIKRTYTTIRKAPLHALKKGDSIFIPSGISVNSMHTIMKDIRPLYPSLIWSPTASDVIYGGRGIRIWGNAINMPMNKTKRLTIQFYDNPGISKAS